MPQVGMLDRLEQRIFVNGILLGGTKSDYYNIIDRDYNMGSGFSVKTKTHLELRHFGRFILDAQYYRIFTWKGYQDKLDQINKRIENGEFTAEYLRSITDDHVKFEEVTGVNLLHLNSQGDKGNAALLVISPTTVFDIARNWSIVLSGSYFVRNTHYKYHDNVKVNTFEVRLGATVHL